MSQELLVFGELGLAGEIRPVPGGQERLKEAAKHGFKTAVVPHGNMVKKTVDGMQLHAVQSLKDAIEWFESM
jgi:DNA repair protein RadA/Sms